MTGLEPVCPEPGRAVPVARSIDDKGKESPTGPASARPYEKISAAADFAGFVDLDAPLSAGEQQDGCVRPVRRQNQHALHHARPDLKIDHFLDNLRSAGACRMLWMRALENLRDRLSASGGPP